MIKFIIQSLVIEKSAKDIKTGIKYEFADGFNIICGNNEAGKSSVIDFISKGFLKEKDVDTGNIIFKITSDEDVNIYRADIKDHKLKNKRLQISNEANDSNLDYIITKHIDSGYFQNAFSINLDDLMSLLTDDNVSLADILTNPAGDKLNSKIEIIKNNAKKIYGDNNRLTSDISKLLKEAENISTEIRRLSSKETDYYNVLNEIKALYEKIDSLKKQYENLNTLKSLKELNNSLENKDLELKKESVNFNDKLYNSKEKYTQIIEDYGKFQNNSVNLNIICQRIDESDNKIIDDIGKLNTLYSLNFTEEDILNFKIDNEINKKIHENSETINLFKQEILNTDLIKKDLEDNLLKLKHEKDIIDLDSMGEINNLTNTYERIEEGLKQYNYILNEITQSENSSASRLNKNTVIVYILSVIFFSAVVIFGIYKNNLISVISGTVLSALALCFLIKISLNKTSEKRNKLIKYKDDIFNELNKIINSYNSEFLNDKEFYTPVLKFESFKQHLYNKIKDYQSLSEKVNKNVSETNYNKEKLENLLNTQNQNKLKTDELINESKELINQINSNADIKIDDYIKVSELINIIKNNIEAKQKLKSELIELQMNNDKIKNEIYNFINDNSIEIQISENIEETVINLKKYYDLNIEIKNKKGILEFEINNLKENINNLRNKIIDNTFENSSVEEIKQEEENLKRTIEEQEELLKKSELNKHDLEHVEGLDKLKIQRNILLNEYRQKIQELYKYKMIMGITEKAKSNLNSSLPDLINAQNYLKILTGGKYYKINPETEKIFNDLTSKDWNELSRGTKEQLYLALRLGYASNYSLDKTTKLPNGRANLPVIIDDAFVNFDSERTKNALSCLWEFSKSNQVLFFTCHSEYILNLINSLNIDNEVKVINI